MAKTSVCEEIKMMELIGVLVHAHEELNQWYTVVDESVVWYGSVDFLAFGRKDTDVFRFKNRVWQASSISFRQCRMRTACHGRCFYVEGVFGIFPRLGLQEAEKKGREKPILFADV